MVALYDSGRIWYISNRDTPTYEDQAGQLALDDIGPRAAVYRAGGWALTGAAEAS